jgi:homoserine kinase
VANTGEGILTRQASKGSIGGELLQVAVAVPDVQLPTHAAREALPKSVPLSDAIFNLSMTAMVLDILKGGDLFMLDEAMNDRIHQPFRIPLIPGARQAMDAARSSGAAAAALSGAGPGVIAFGLEDMSIVAEDMVRAFEKVGIKARGYALSASEEGASTGWYDFEDAAK